MAIRRCIVLALSLSGWLILPILAHGQHTQGDEVETIEPPKIKPAPDAKKPDLDAVAKAVVERTNAFRKEQGRKPVDTDTSLHKAASYFAAYMARTDRYGHNADGNQPADRAKKHDYSFCIVLENIAYEYNSRGFTTKALTNGFVEGWKHSPGHRRNMLDADVTNTGVAVARSETTGYYYAVQMFGRPKSQAISFKIANESEAVVRYAVAGHTFKLQPRYTRSHTLCRPSDVTFYPAGEKPATKDEGKKVRPRDGDHYVLSDDKDGYRLKKK